MGALGAAIAARAQGRPIGWVQISGNPEGATTLAHAWAEEVPEAGIIYTPGASRPPNGTYAVEAGNTVVFEIIESWLVHQLFSFIVVDLFDAIAPRGTFGPGYRAWWIGYQAGRLRSLMYKSRAVVVAVCHAPRSGGQRFQSEVGLRLDCRQNGRGTGVIVGGRLARLGADPFVMEVEMSRVLQLREDGDQLMITLEDFVDLQTSPAVFIGRSSADGRTLEQYGLSGLHMDRLVGIRRELLAQEQRMTDAEHTDIP